VGKLLASEIGWERAVSENYSHGAELRDLIRSHPDVFAPFYCFESRDFDRKVDLLASWGLGLGDREALSEPVQAQAREAPAGWQDAPRLPSLSDAVVLRKVAGRDFLFDSAGCLLYEPTAACAEVFRACHGGEAPGELIARLARATASSESATAGFVGRTLAAFSEKGVLSTVIRG
jgi:hypothetical protein